MTSRNQGYAYREQLGPGASGLKLHAYLAQRYAHSTPAEWAVRLEAGELELDGARASGEELLRSGQWLVWNRPPWTEPEVPLTYGVIHEDSEVLVVDKPSGLPSAPAGGFLAHTLLALVRERDPEWTPMHRLGRGTSGLVVFARTPRARGVLQAAFRDHEIEKRYLALASGALAAPLVIRAPIGSVVHPRLGRLHAASDSGKFAESHIERAEPRGADTRAEVRITTGRPHQIRIHLAWAGHPLVGDPLYGPGGLPKGELPALPGELGYLLHAWRIGFEHPATGRRVQFEAPAPAGLA